MSTVKISQLPTIELNANTSNTLFVVVDTQSLITGKVTEYNVAKSLYNNNILNVGQNPVLLSGVTGQFSGDTESFLQINLQNTNQHGSGDFVVTADIGSDVYNYIDVGINNSGYDDVEFSSMKALDGYLYVSGSTSGSYDGNLIIGTASTNSSTILISGGTKSDNIVGKFNNTRFNLLRDVDVTGNITSSGIITTNNFIINGNFTANGQNIYTTKKYTLDFSQTELILNFEEDSTVSANIINNTNITLSNLGIGREINLWLTNTSNENLTITHGLSSMNSTSNSVTFILNPVSSTHLKYFSTGSNVGNTFVSIINT